MGVYADVEVMHVVFIVRVVYYVGVWRGHVAGTFSSMYTLVDGDEYSGENKRVMCPMYMVTLSSVCVCVPPDVCTHRFQHLS